LPHLGFAYLPGALETHAGPGRAGDSGDANCGGFCSDRGAWASKKVWEIDGNATEEAW
jgi:hypothetical protein